MTTPEGRIKAQLDRMLKDEAVWFYSPQAGPHGRSGIPDRIAIVDGVFVGIEAKADPTKKPTRLQNKCMDDIRRAGGVCFVVYDKDSIEEARKFIRQVRAITVAKQKLGVTHVGGYKGEGARTEPEEPCAGTCDDTDG